MLLAQRVQAALDDVYHPDGYNLGMNLGRSAGAGIADHLHMHLLPRWTGDTNFMTTVGETRLEPEELSTTYTKLRKALARSARLQRAWIESRCPPEGGRYIFPESPLNFSTHRRTRNCCSARCGSSPKTK